MMVDAPVAGAGRSGPTRRRLGRTLAVARWSEYRTLLEHALAAGYSVVSLEHWLDHGEDARSPTLILRHDVDQHPRCVGPLLAVEQSLGLTSTWYFRWRTADPRVIKWVQNAGGEVGLHYETLTRRVLRGEAVGEPGLLVDSCRAELVDEIQAFQQRFGLIRSVCPHGDSRTPDASNQVLMRGLDPASFGVEYDGNDALGRHRLSAWVTDRSAPDGRWKDGIDPLDLVKDRRTPILCLTHPNNLVSGGSLWADRLAAAALRMPAPTARRRPIRTGTDEPLVARRGDPVPAASPFAPVMRSLNDAVVEYNAHRGAGLTGRAGLNTLLTNSTFAERRADTLLSVLFEHSDLDSLAGLRVLDVGCGFGALALVFASRGAKVTAIDPSADRYSVGHQVASHHGLAVRFRQGWMEELALETGTYDLVVLNNSFCYLLDPGARQRALAGLRAALRAGGWLVMRNPNRLFPRDQFTGLPGVGMLPPKLADRVARRFGRRRSAVRLQTVAGQRRELSQAGFVDIAAGSPHDDRLHRRLVPVSRYQHLVARRALRSARA